MTSESGRALVDVETKGTASPFSFVCSLSAFSRSSNRTTRLGAPLPNLRDVLERPDERGKYVEVVAGVDMEDTGTEATLVNCRVVVFEGGGGGAGSMTVGALSERESDARLLIADGEGECSGDGV